MPECHELTSSLSSLNAEGFEYDVFLSYHDECDGLVRQLILGPLRAAGYAVCYHHDDFEPGVGIYDNIYSNMDKSRVAVLVLTEVLLRAQGFLISVPLFIIGITSVWVNPLLLCYQILTVNTQ